MSVGPRPLTRWFADGTHGNAALITAAILLVLAAVLGLIGAKSSFRRGTSRGARRRATTEFAEELEALSGDLEQMGRQMGATATRNSGWLMAGALAAGLAAVLAKKNRRKP